MVDSRLDLTLELMLRDLCLQVPLDVNPYFRCVSHLRAAMWLQEMWQETDKAIGQKVGANFDELQQKVVGTMVRMPLSKNHLNGMGHALSGIAAEATGKLFEDFAWLAVGSEDKVWNRDDFPEADGRQIDLSGAECRTLLALVGSAPLVGTFLRHHHVIEFEELYVQHACSVHHLY